MKKYVSDIFWSMAPPMDGNSQTSVSTAASILQYYSIIIILC